MPYYTLLLKQHVRDVFYECWIRNPYTPPPPPSCLLCLSQTKGVINYFQNPFKLSCFRRKTRLLLLWLLLLPLICMTKRKLVEQVLAQEMYFSSFVVKDLVFNLTKRFHKTSSVRDTLIQHFDLSKYIECVN